MKSQTPAKLGKRPRRLCLTRLHKPYSISRKAVREQFPFFNPLLPHHFWCLSPAQLNRTLSKRAVHSVAGHQSMANPAWCWAQITNPPPQHCIDVIGFNKPLDLDFSNPNIIFDTLVRLKIKNGSWQAMPQG